MLAHRIRHVKHGKPPSQGVNAAAASDAACLMGTDRKEIADDDGDDDDPESMFSESLPLLFPDETFTFTGAPGETLEYVSPLFKSVTVHVPDQDAAATGNSQFTADEVTHETLRAPEDPVDSRALFAHLLWGGALVICDEIEKTALELRSQAVPCQRLNLERQLWRVENEDVLELGAGAGLPSLISLLCGANSVTITDHPSATGIRGPNQKSIAALGSSSTEAQPLWERADIQPHKWGDLPKSSVNEPHGGSSSSSNQAFAVQGKSSFSRIVCADCLWMSDQHDNLAKSIAWFLRKPSSTPDPAAGGVAYVVAGFHTGRSVVAKFFEKAVPRHGLRIEKIYERDLNALDETTVVREWQANRPGETDLPRWNVVGILRREE